MSVNVSRVGRNAAKIRAGGRRRPHSLPMNGIPSPRPSPPTQAAPEASPRRRGRGRIVSHSPCEGRFSGSTREIDFGKISPREERAGRGLGRGWGEGHNTLLTRNASSAEWPSSPQPSPPSKGGVGADPRALVALWLIEGRRRRGGRLLMRR